MQLRSIGMNAELKSGNLQLIADLQQFSSSAVREACLKLIEHIKSVGRRYYISLFLLFFVYNKTGKSMGFGKVSSKPLCLQQMYLPDWTAAKNDLLLECHP